MAREIWPDTIPLTESALLSSLDSSGSARFGLLVCSAGGADMLPLREGLPIVVGRAPPSDVVLGDAGLSRRHVRIALEAERVSVEDLGSLNGTFVNGSRIERVELAPGDTVKLAGVTLSLHLLEGTRIGQLGRLGSHAEFLGAVGAELARSRFFGRGLAVCMLRALDRKSSVHTFVEAVQKALRPVDRAALWSLDSVEVLLPEAGEAEATAVVDSILGRSIPTLTAAVVLHARGTASRDRIIELCRDALRQTSASNRVQISKTESAAPHSAETNDGLIAESPAMKTVLTTATRLARGVIPVLLLGETGTGKEVLARHIHDRGPRGSRPLICVNCGAIPAELVESVLFGHERGSFTGATGQHKGVFEAADGGSVLLDEVGELSAAAQAALLRVLETKRVMRVGSNKEIPVDVRILAATHRDLDALVESGEFRQDLLYRLNALTLQVPPLRDRPEDIVVMARAFLVQANRANDCAVEDIDPDALELLAGHAWPGNVRELRNVIERATVIAQGTSISPEDLPEHVAPPVAPPSSESDYLDFRTRMERLEADVIVKALERAGWNQTAAARDLSMPLRTLQYKIKVLGIARPPRAKKPK